jgi:hypothetical protein
MLLGSPSVPGGLEIGMSWTQPCCEDCWVAREGARRPSRLRIPESEKCAFCGRVTRAGIYVRVNPATVRYPTIEEES